MWGPRANEPACPYPPLPAIACLCAALLPREAKGASCIGSEAFRVRGAIMFGTSALQAPSLALLTLPSLVEPSLPCSLVWTPPGRAWPRQPTGSALLAVKLSSS